MFFWKYVLKFIKSEFIISYEVIFVNWKLEMVWKYQ